jgi:hypothetical protein
VVQVGGYTSGSGVTGIAGSIYYDTTDSVLKYSNGSNWTSLASGSDLLGATAGSTIGYVNGATLTSSNYLLLGAATTSHPGLVTTLGQTFSGDKTFLGSFVIGDSSSDKFTINAGATFSAFLTGTTGTFSNTVTAVAFNSTSDYRIKENIKELSLDNFTIDKLRPVNYYNKIIGKEDIGFISHEVQQYLPLLVNGIKDGEQEQNMNYIGLIGILVKEIQELKKRINLLEEKVK